MVEKVIAKNDNIEIIFKLDHDNVWRATLPSNLNGEYYLDLYAIDKAGNIGYCAKALFIIDGKELCIHLLEKKYKVKLYFTNSVNHCLHFTNDYECRIKEELPCNIL